MAQEVVPATSFFDQRFGVTSRDLDKVLSRALESKADYADLYFEYRCNEAISLEEGMVKNASNSAANGVGVRVLAEAKLDMPLRTTLPLKIWNWLPVRRATSPKTKGPQCLCPWAEQKAYRTISIRWRSTIPKLN